MAKFVVRKFARKFAKRFRKIVAVWAILSLVFGSGGLSGAFVWKCIFDLVRSLRRNDSPIGNDADKKSKGVFDYRCFYVRWGLS